MKTYIKYQKIYEYILKYGCPKGVAIFFPLTVAATCGVLDILLAHCIRFANIMLAWQCW